MSEIVLIGDVMLDVYISGVTNRIAQEAPIAIIKETGRRSVLGGAGNVYANLRGSGVDPYFITAVGDDEGGQYISNMISAGQVNIDNKKPTTIKTRIKSKTYHNDKMFTVCRIDKEDNSPIKNYELNNQSIKALKTASIVLISDYGKGLVNNETVASIKSFAKNAKFIGDPKINLAMFKDFYAVTPNQFELSELTGDTETILKYIKETYNIKHPIITLGKDGCKFINEKNKLQHLTASNHKLVDVIGAGDVFISYFTSAISKNMSITDSIKVAIQAAGISIGIYGSTVIKENQINWRI